MQPRGSRRTARADARRGRARPWASAALAWVLIASLANVRVAHAAVFINVMDAALTLIPTPTDYENDYVEATGPAGIRLKVKTNSPAGLVLMVRSVVGSPGIAFGDLLVRTLTAPGVGGAALSTYTAVGATNLNLWSTGAAQGPFKVVEMDVRIRNLFGYDDGGAAGATSYTNTLIFTVLEP